MGDCSVNGPGGVKIESVAQMFGQFSGEVLAQMPDWQRKLMEEPGELDALEHEVHRAFARGAGLIVAGLVAVVMGSEELAQASEQTRQQFSRPLARGRRRTLRVRLLGGLFMWITSLYCEPRRGLFRKPDDQARGLHIELAQFGFGKGVSPGLQTQVARQAALCPSFQLAQMELKRGGVTLDTKTVRRVAHQCGEELLKLRTAQLMQWRDGTLASTDELAGKRVTVQIDGGRTKLRGDLRAASPQSETLSEDGLVISDAPGRSKTQPRQTFDADWREPKLVTIFIHNEQGRMVKNSPATLDGTFAGPDAMAELVAMHLHRLGAARALSLTFVSDGAPWIWDRVDRIVALARIPATVKIHQVLDNCHASHHISLALASLGIDEQARMPLYRELRTRLRNGEWRFVVDELQMFADDNRDNAKLQTEVNYLVKHGEAGRLKYREFRRLGLPLGSGAIESSIRRVINLRLKSNGMFWREEHAESMLQLRSLVISDRWDERVRLMRQSQRCIQLPDWRWTPHPMSCKTEPEPHPPENTA